MVSFHSLSVQQSQPFITDAGMSFIIIQFQQMPQKISELFLNSQFSF